MAFDRVAALRQAEKLIRQGRLDQAIVEYTRVVDEQPKDWATANLLGDLLARAGRLEEAVQQFGRCADTLRLLGFVPKAAALYKKILNLRPDDDHALVQSGELAAAQGLMVDARRFLVAAADARRERGDHPGSQQILARLDALAAGSTRPAARGAAVAGPGPAAGGPAGADRDPALVLALAEMRLRTGDATTGLAILDGLFARHEPSVEAGADLAARLAKEMHDDTGFMLADRVASACETREDWTAAARTMRLFLASRPDHVNGLRRWAEIATRGGLVDQAVEARVRLVEAYVAGTQVPLARAVADAIVTEHPELAEARERLGRVLRDAGVTDFDQVPAGPLVMNESEKVASIPESLAQAPPQAPHAIDLAGILEESGAPQAGEPPAAEADEIDLTGMLDELPATSDVTLPVAADIDEVFRQLREDAEGDRGPESAELAFQRGEALHEAGQLDDCLEPLKMGARNPSRRFEAASLLARRYQARKEMAEAIQWLGIAAESPGVEPGARRTTMLELAGLLESTGDTAGALAVCLELHAEAGEYEDVSIRIARLVRAETGG